MKNRLEDLRNHLFAQMERLMDCDDKDLEDECKRTAHIVQLANSLIESGRAETEFLFKISDNEKTNSVFFKSKQNTKLIAE